jgi:hypothetical protein
MQARFTRRTARLVRQDVSFVVSILLLFMVVVAGLTAWAGDEAEFLGLSDDLHALAGWGMLVLTLAHVLLHADLMVSFVRRRLRKRSGER